MGYNNMTSFFKTFCAVSFAGILSACSTMNNNEAAPEKYSDLHFDNKKPIELMVKKIEGYLTAAQLFRKRNPVMINLQKLLDEMNDRR